MREAELPDGTVLEFPDGTSDDVMQKAVKKYLGSSSVNQSVTDAMDARAVRPQSMNKVQRPEAPKETGNGFLDIPKALKNPSAENIAGDPFTRFALGAGKNLVGAGQMAIGAISPGARKVASSLVFNPLIERFKRTEEIGNPEHKVDIMGLAGEALSPVGLGVTKSIAPATGFLGKVGQGSLFGATQAVTTPTTDADGFELKKLGQAATGATVGAVIPTVGEAAKFIGRSAKDLINAFLPSGAEKISTKYANEIVGPDNMQKIVKDITEQLNRQGTGTFVPGYKKTVGEMVSHMPEASPLLALQQGTGSTARGVSAQFGQRAADNQAAIVNALRPIAGTPQELAAAEGKRAATGKVLYDAATKANPKIDEALVSTTDNPYFIKAWPEAKRMADAAGKSDTTTYLHNIKLILDNELQKTGDSALNRGQRKLVGDLQRNVVEWLKTSNPVYDIARSEFRSQSIPINRMQVGQALEAKLTSPTGAETPGAFLRAISDETKTVKNVLGQPRSDFGQVFSGKEQATINEIGGLLENSLSAKKPLQPTILSGRNVAEDATASLPSILSRPVVIANWALKTLTSGKSSLEARVDAVNAYRLLNPEKFVEAMKTLPPSKRELIAKEFSKQGISIYNQGLIAPTTSGLLGATE